MRKYKKETDYENMNSEQLNAEMLRMKLYKMQIDIEITEELYLREKNERDREESALAYARKLKWKRAKQKLEQEAMEKSNNKIPESKKEQAPVTPTIKSFRTFFNVE